MKSIRLCLLLACSMLLTTCGCAGLQPAYPPARPVSDFLSLVPGTAAADRETVPIVTPIAIWRARGGCYLDVLVESTNWESAERGATQLGSMTFFGVEPSPLELVDGRGQRIAVEGVSYESLDPITRVQFAPPAARRLPIPNRHVAAVTLMFRADIDVADEIEVSINHARLQASSPASLRLVTKSASTMLQPDDADANQSGR